LGILCGTCESQPSELDIPGTAGLTAIFRITGVTTLWDSEEPKLSRRTVSQFWLTVNHFDGLVFDCEESSAGARSVTPSYQNDCYFIDGAEL
jgi:hypothetical protein